MSRIIKTYDQYLAEGLETESLSGLASKTKGIIKKFFGMGASYLSALADQLAGKRSENGEEGTIPYGVTIFPSKYDLGRLRAGSHVQEEEIQTDALSEAVVPLDFPDPKAGIPNVGNERLHRLIRRVIHFPNERPLMIWGAPGIGKTSIVKAVQKEYGGRLIDIQLTTYSPEDFFLPEREEGQTANPKSRRASRLPQGWLPLYHESEGEEGNKNANGPDGMGGIIFLDELSRAKEAIRNICLKLVLDREMDGGWKLGSKWRIIAASNRAEDDETNSAEFGSALGNRFQQVNYSPSIKDYSKWALSAKTEEGEDLFDPRIISFLNWTKGQEFFHKLDPQASTTLFPTPRSWEGAAIAWKNLKKDAETHGYRLTPEIIETEAIEPNIGKEAASMFMGYYVLSQKIDLDKVGLVFTNPDHAPIPPRNQSTDEYEIDSSYILASSIAYETRGRRLTIPEIDNLFKYVVRLKNPTVAMQILQAILDIHPYFMEISKREQDPLIMAWFKAMTGPFRSTYPGSAKELENIMNVD